MDYITDVFLFLIEFLGFSFYKIMSSASKDNFTLSLQFSPIYFFFLPSYFD